MSDYFDYSSGRLTAGTTARASDVNNTFDEIDTGLDKLPSEADLKRGLINYATDSGAANAYVVTLSYTPTSYTDGMEVVFKAANANTGASTINVNSLGAKSIKRQDGGSLLVGDIPSNKIIPIRYNSTSGFFEIQGGVGATGSGTMASQNANAVEITGGTINLPSAGTSSGDVVTIDGTQTLSAKNFSDTLTLSKASGTSLTVSSGNIGIGLASAGRPLHVQKTGADTAIIRIEATDYTVAGIELNSGHGNWGVYNSDTISDAFEIRDDNNNATRLIIDSSGRIAIGSATPTQKFHIQGGGIFYHQGASYASLHGYEHATGGNTYRLTTGDSERLQLMSGSTSPVGLTIDVSGHTYLDGSLYGQTIYLTDDTISTTVGFADSKQYIVVTSSHPLSLGSYNDWDKIVLNETTVNITSDLVVSGEVEGTSLDINGSADISTNLVVGGTVSNGVGPLIAYTAASDNQIARYNGTNAVQGCGITIDDSNNILAPMVSIGSSDSHIKDLGNVNGNLHLDAREGIGNGDGRVHLSYLEGNGVVFGNGGHGEVGSVDSTGNMTIAGEFEGTSLDINGNGDISGTANIHDTLTLSKASGTALSVTADIDVDGTINGDGLDIDGNSDISGTLALHGKGTFSGGLNDGSNDLSATFAEINTLCSGITATAAEINTACDGSTAKNSHTHTLADGGTDVTATAAEINNSIDGCTATAAEINTACDGSTAKNSHTHTLADGGTDVTATAAEINTACDGIGVSIPKRKIVNIGDWNMDSIGTITVAHDLTVTKIRGITGVIRNDGDTTYYPIGNIESSGSGAYPDSWFRYIDGTNVSIARQTGGLFDSVTFDSTSYNRGYLIIDYID